MTLGTAQDEAPTWIEMAVFGLALPAWPGASDLADEEMLLRTVVAGSGTVGAIGSPGLHFTLGHPGSGWGHTALSIAVGDSHPLPPDTAGEPHAGVFASPPR